jgi:hypothetical protein
MTTRRLVAIVSADVAESSRLMEADETGTLAASETGRDDEARWHRDRMLELKPHWTPDHLRQDLYRRAEDIDHVGDLMRDVAGLGPTIAGP